MWMLAPIRQTRPDCAGFHCRCPAILERASTESNICPYPVSPPAFSPGARYMPDSADLSAQDQQAMFQLFLELERQWALACLVVSKGTGRHPLMVQWVQDEECEHCNACGVEFSFFLRKHHCRMCGLLLCHECSPHVRQLPGHLIQKLWGGSHVYHGQADTRARVLMLTRQLDELFRRASVLDWCTSTFFVVPPRHSTTAAPHCFPLPPATVQQLLDQEDARSAESVPVRVCIPCVRVLSLTDANSSAGDKVATGPSGSPAVGQGGEVGEEEGAHPGESTARQSGDTLEVTTTDVLDVSAIVKATHAHTEPKMPEDENAGAEQDVSVHVPPAERSFFQLLGF